ncbi:DUF1716 family protein [Schizosaccharomyces japonicus yFS275]|uniref:DUF1716 family protein n=1 Tax=Schizosaccharomyces japonicus (strain yFS275 / FY16936) TaxID=402676 RepID=B6K150_SCHJY|nr:DUF1716 family protein [Schizosaccharomyces japonicus yFS275]EEB07671.1 DUF1716 family protein [Schizosaccharomyces japonicus yFS275]
MNVDAIFKESNGPLDKKRKLEDGRYVGVDAENHDGHPEQETKSKSEEEYDEEGGRFFGGGLTEKEEKALNFLNTVDDGDNEPTFDAAALKKKIIALEKALNKNQMLRTKYPNAPEKFIESEADLDAEIHGLTVLSEYPELYSDLVQLNTTNTLFELFGHENIDIVIAIIDLLVELTDEDVEPDSLIILQKDLIEKGLFSIITEIMKRMNEENEDDAHGVFASFQLVENLVSINADVCEEIKNTDLIQFLLNRASKQEATVSENLQFSVELLAVLCSKSPAIRVSIVEKNGIEILLNRISLYARRNPVPGLEAELMQNAFDVLCSVVEEQQGKMQFLKEEGIELCLLMLQQKKQSRKPAFKLVDHALFGPLSLPLCNRFVEFGGLKYLFSTFMKKMEAEMLEHICAIMASLFRSLAADTPERIRFLAKFVEKDFTKTKKLVDFYSKLRKPITEIRQSAKAQTNLEEDSLALFLKQIDMGLFSFQSIVVILAWLCCEDSAICECISNSLKAFGLQLHDLLSDLQDYFENFAESPETISDEKSEESIPRVDEKPMVQTLLEIMQIQVHESQETNSGRSA